MTIRRNTPAYVSPVLEPYRADKADIKNKARDEVLNLDAHQIDSLVATSVLCLATRKCYFNLIHNDTTIEQRRVFAIDALSIDRITKIEEKESQRRIRLLSDSGEQKVMIVIGPDDVLPEQPRRITPSVMKAFGEIDIPEVTDPDETIETPAFPVPNTPAERPLPPSYRPSAPEAKRTITLPPRELDPCMPPMQQPAYPKTTPIEFLPRSTRLPQTTYSFLLDLDEKNRKEKDGH